jgi:tetratricopeptide (TPR) repeat protein
MSHPSDKIRQLMRDGIFALERSNMEAAEEYFEEAFQLDGKYAEAANKLAVTHFHASNYEECLQWALQTLEMNPRHYGALAGAARSCAKLGREEQATAYFVRVLELHPWAAHVPSELLACMQSAPADQPSPPQSSAKEEVLSEERLERIVIEPPSPIPQQEHEEKATESSTEPTK